MYLGKSTRDQILFKYSKIQIGCRKAERARHVCDTMDREQERGDGIL